jgi:hypothetical protein
MGEFVSAGSGGLNGPRDLTFGPDGHLYVSSERTDNVLRYDGRSGSFIDQFISSNDSRMRMPTDLYFVRDGARRFPDASILIITGVALPLFESRLKDTVTQSISSTPPSTQSARFTINSLFADSKSSDELRNPSLDLAICASKAPRSAECVEDVGKFDVLPHRDDAFWYLRDCRWRVPCAA